MKRNVLLLAGILILALVVLVPSCRKEIYTDKDALAAMKEAQKYKNDLEKELLALELTNQLQLDGLRSQLTLKEYQTMDSLQKIGGKTSVSIQVYDITGNTTAMDGFSVTVNQNGAANTLTTDANGFVVFPDFMYGSSSIVVTKTGFARASGIMSIGSSSMNRQQAVLVPVFPTESATAKISGTLTAQLDLTTEAPEAVKDGIISINFTNIWNILNNPNSSLDETYGLAGIIYDGGFMQTVKTGADGKYEFSIPKTKNNIGYDFSVSTIQKKQKLLFGDYPVRLDTMRLDSVPVYFGYDSWSSAIWDGNQIGYQYYDGWGALVSEFPGLNINIEAPTGGQTPTAPASISWAHNDSTVVTWSFSKFASGDGGQEFTNITQAPVFEFDQDLSKVQVVTPTAGALNIVNGKLISMYMTNGGSYKEYGRATGKIIPTQNTGTKFKFLEQLTTDDATNWSEDTTYQTAVAKASVILHNGVVKVAFKTNNDWVTDFTRKGKGYTAVPNVSFTLNTPLTGDSVLTQSNLRVNLLAGGGLSIDTLVLSKYTSTTGFSITAQPDFATFKRDGVMHGGNHYVIATPTTTYKVDLLNGLKIADGGLGYKTAPKVRIQNYAAKQGTTNSWTKQTIAEAATTIDASGRIIAVADPVMVDNFKIQETWAGLFNNQNEVSVPANVDGLAQAWARATVDPYGSIIRVQLYDEFSEEWRTDVYGANYVSGQGYVTIPKITVTPVGKISVTEPAVLQAVVNTDGRISDIIIVDGGKGYDVKNNANALSYPGDLNDYLETNGSSDFVYNINLGSGWHGDPNDIF